MRILIKQFRHSGSADDAVVVLRYWANFSDRRIADMLGCRKATVRSLAAGELRAARHTPGRRQCGYLRPAAGSLEATLPSVK